MYKDVLAGLSIIAMLLVVGPYAGVFLTLFVLFVLPILVAAELIREARANK